MIAGAAMRAAESPSLKLKWIDAQIAQFTDAAAQWKGKSETAPTAERRALCAKIAAHYSGLAESFAVYRGFHERGEI